MAERNAVVEVTAQNFQAEVVDRSATMPVVLLFWTDQVPPSVEALRQLEKLVAQYPGRVAMALSDVARDQTLAQHLRVQGLPSIRVIDNGQLVDQLEGPQSEAQLKDLIERLTLSSADMLRDQLSELLAAGEHQAALAVVRRMLEEEPNNAAFKVELADLLLLTGELDQARTVLAGVGDEVDGRDRPATRLELLEEAAGMPEGAALSAQLEADPDDLEVRYQAAVRAAAAGEYERALELAMSLLQRDREFRDDIGRTTMIRVFALLGKGSELATQYRRRMFNYMH